MSGNSHDYEALHGTQEKQAAKQATEGRREADGPWRLERWGIRDGSPVLLVLSNSVRSTLSEAEALQKAEEARTDILWGIVPC